MARSIERSIHKSIADAISRQCKCVFLPEYIGPGTFSCRNATTEATYRSKINGTVSHNVSQVMNLVQNWVDTRPILPVDWWMLSVYTNCPVHIPESHTYPECQTSGSPSNQTLVISNPQTIQCINTCLHRQQHDV